MDIKNILVSQPYPTSDKSPYFDIQRKFGVTLHGYRLPLEDGD